MKQRLQQKFINLYKGELFSIIMFPCLWFFYPYVFKGSSLYLHSYSSLYAFFLLEFILIQGCYYWYLKAYNLKNGCALTLQRKHYTGFWLFKMINLVLLLFGLFLLFFLILISSPVLYWYLFVYVFAVIEYINYYHIRLSYFTFRELRSLFQRKSLKRSILAKELENFKKEEV